MEKLNIDPEKIIPILLKHLMDQRNEIAYLKNKAALHLSNNEIPESKVGINQLAEGIPESKVGVNQLAEGIPESKVGVNQLAEGIPESKVGENQLAEGIPESKVGVNQLAEGIPESKVGVNQLAEGIPESKVGVNQFAEGIPESKVGVNQLTEGVPESKVGVNQLTEALTKLFEDKNGEILLYTVFEKELIQALEHYIKNGDGQNSLYKFYRNFVDAVNERNSDDSKIKDAAINLRLEDTHSLPDQLTLDKVSMSKLKVVLKAHLPRTSRRDIYNTVAQELLLLYNARSATSAQMRDFGELSVFGFAKHLANLMRYGLVKKLPPSNYVLTEKSNHILLELFGIPKAL